MAEAKAMEVNQDGHCHAGVESWMSVRYEYGRGGGVQWRCGCGDDGVLWTVGIISEEGHLGYVGPVRAIGKFKLNTEKCLK